MGDYLRKRECIGIYILIVILFSLFLLVDVWLNNFLIFKIIFFFIEDKNYLIQNLIIKKSIIYTIIGCIMGGLITSFKGLHSYVEVDKWNTQMAISYYLGPFITIILGISVYCIFSAGFLFVSLGKENISSNSNMAFSIGFFSGLSWDLALEKFYSSARSLFSKKEKPKEEVSTI